MTVVKNFASAGLLNTNALVITVNYPNGSNLPGRLVSVSVIYPYITMTDFEKNTVKSSERDWSSENNEEEEDNGAPFKPDTAEYVAQKIVEGIESGEAEVFVHDWMKKH